MIEAKGEYPAKDSPRAAWHVVESASDCSDHRCDVPFSWSDIEMVYSADYGCDCGSFLDGSKVCNSYCGTWGSAIFRLTDGRYVIAQEWADTTGHG